MREGVLLVLFWTWNSRVYWLFFPDSPVTNEWGDIVGSFNAELAFFILIVIYFVREQREKDNNKDNN